MTRKPTKELQYQFPAVPAEWSASRQTSHGVAVAIHAIASGHRTPERIWGAPTRAEVDHVQMALDNYINADMIDDEDMFDWGAAHFHPVRRPLGDE